jgi:hypothetical protein
MLQTLSNFAHSTFSDGIGNGVQAYSRLLLNDASVIRVKFLPLNSIAFVELSSRADTVAADNYGSLERVCNLAL